MHIVIYVLFISYIIQSLKNIYITPRPYQIYPEIEAKECSQSFGRPSGHAAGGLALYFSLFAIFIMPLKSSLPTRKPSVLKITVGFIVFAMIFLIGVSRIYLGVHSFS